MVSRASLNGIGPSGSCQGACVLKPSASDGRACIVSAPAPTVAGTWGLGAAASAAPDTAAAPSFIVAGSAESEEGKGDYRDNLIARGDTSAKGLHTKARWVLGEMERRMAALGFDWSSATATLVYTVHDFHPFVGDELVRRGAMP